MNLTGAIPRRANISLFNQVKNDRKMHIFLSPHRGYWFYIANNDLETKSSFLLLQQLFSLQAGQSEAKGPTLTLPVGGR